MHVITYYVVSMLTFNSNVTSSNPDDVYCKIFLNNKNAFMDLFHETYFDQTFVNMYFLSKFYSFHKSIIYIDWKGTWKSLFEI